MLIAVLAAWATCDRVAIEASVADWDRRWKDPTVQAEIREAVLCLIPPEFTMDPLAAARLERLAARIEAKSLNPRPALIKGYLASAQDRDPNWSPEPDDPVHRYWSRRVQKDPGRGTKKAEPPVEPPKVLEPSAPRYPTIRVAGGVEVSRPALAGVRLADKVTRAEHIEVGAEVSQELYASLMNNAKPSDHADCPKCPVESVSWEDALRFANALSLDEGLQECYQISEGSVVMPYGLHCTGYRLPTEVEWFVVASASAQNPERPGWRRDNSEGNTHPIGTAPGEGAGPADLWGNVAEWVWDDWPQAPGGSSPVGTVQPRPHLALGPSWISRDADDIYHRIDLSDKAHPALGFRLVRTAPDDGQAP